MGAGSGGTSLIWILLATLSVRWAAAVRVGEGGSVTLACQYSAKRLGLRPVCWGRACGTFWCHDILVQTDERGVVSKLSDRYRLSEDVLAGNVDLLIPSVHRTDSGLYCCRVDIDGLFNDQKVTHTLRVQKAPTVQTTTTRTTTTPTPTRTEETTEPPTPTKHWKAPESPHEEIFRWNSSVLHSGTVVEDAGPAGSLQVSVPVLSLCLSLCLLLLLLGALGLLAYTRGIHRRALKTGCLSAKEPPHIIYEIRMRRPVEENIYTLD